MDGQLIEHQLSDEDWENPVSDDEDEGVFSVDAHLLPSDGKNAYRTRNSTADPYQRTTGTDYHKGAIRVRCKILDIVHGTLSPYDTTSFATLIVFRFAFYSKRHSSRARSVDIELVFKGHGPNDANPEVIKVAPEGKYCLMPKTQHETMAFKASGGVNALVGGGVGAKGSLGWEKVSVRERTEYATVIGEAGQYGMDKGEDDGAAWTLLENRILEDGVPQAFQSAVLLRRKDATSHFQCDLKITVTTDRWTAFANLFKSRPLDDPILFDPQRQSTDGLMTYTTNRLGEVDLTDLEDIIIMKIKSGVVNEAESKGRGGDSAEGAS